MATSGWDRHPCSGVPGCAGTGSLSGVKRIFRRVVPVVGKLCCGSQTFLIEMLVLVPPDGTNLELYIGDDLEKDAKALYQALQEAHPELEYGVVK